jgi:hypothetical protein
VTADPAATDRRVRRWWSGYAVALFLLLPVDLLTTIVSVSTHGIGVEANPVMRWLLGRGLVEVVLVHLVVAAFSVYAFHVAVGAVRDAPDSYRRPLVCGVDAWVAFVVAVGILLVVNNLSVVF